MRTFLFILLSFPLFSQDYIVLPDSIPLKAKVRSGECLRIRIDADPSVTGPVEQIYENVRKVYASFEVYVDFDIVYAEHYRWGDEETRSSVYLRRYAQNRTDKDASGRVYDHYQLLTANATSGGASFYKGYGYEVVEEPSGVLWNYSTSVCPYSRVKYTQKCAAHELGHALGSLHTHACNWNGDHTALDGCWSTEPVQGPDTVYRCERPSFPEKGSVMSYCNFFGLWDFVFRPPVQDTVLAFVGSTSPCEITSTSILSEDEVKVSPNPFSNVFSVSPAPDKMEVFTMDGKKGRLFDMPPGMYVLRLFYKRKIIHKTIVRQ